MTTTFDPNVLVGRTACDLQRDKIGKVGQVYLDDQTGQPSWVAINTGWFGTRQSFAPLEGAVEEGGDLVLPFDKDLVKDAPNIEPEGRLDPTEEQVLYQHYASFLGAQTTRGTGVTGSGTTQGSTDDAMTRSEEQVRIGTQPVETGRARLRKYVVTENVTQTVPVSREEVRVEREPITDTNVDAAMSGADISEAEHEVTLREQRPVIEKETVPVERVRLQKETVTEEEPVSAEVRKEQIKPEGVDDTTGTAQ